jgi:hypothetical protein
MRLAVPALWFAFAGVQAAAAGNPQVSSLPASTEQARIEATQRKPPLLLLELGLRQSTLAESLMAYGDEDDPLLPLGELSRLLELSIDVNPPAGRANGVIGDSQRTLVVDVAARLASIGGTRLALADGDFWAGGNDLYLRASLIEKLLPLKLAINAGDLRIDITPTEQLPLEAHAARERNRLAIGAAPALTPEYYQIAQDYGWLSYPAFDVGAEIGRDGARNGFTRRFEARAAADVFKTTFTGFIGTDDTGRPSAANMRFERRDPTGSLFGPIGATYAAAGDVFTPSLAIGPRSYGGAGAVISNADQSNSDVFERTTLRGDLPIGFDAELYINEVLRGSQSRTSDGRYEFVDVPLVRGINVIKIVLYGPRGERHESTRVINIGAGLLEPGQIRYDAGFVFQERPVFEFERGKVISSGLAKAEPRAVASVAVGLSQTLSAIAGASSFDDYGGERHNLATAGLRGSLAGVAIQADFAHDFGFGSALVLGGAGRLGNTSYIVRHIEYSGAFADESNLFYDPSRSMQRFTELQLDTVVPFANVGGLPISLRARQAQFGDGGKTINGQLRTTLSMLDTLFAVASDVQYRSYAGGHDTQWTGNLAASRRIGEAWQLRASLDAEFAPRPTVRAMTVTADRSLSERFGIRGGAAKSFGSLEEFTVFGAGTARLPFANAALNADYATERKELRLSLQFNVGFAFDPIRRHYRTTRPGPATGASASFEAFTDDNGDGRRGPGENPVPGVLVAAGDYPVRTDAEGRAFVTGLGSSASTLVHTDTSGLDLFYMTSPPQDVVFAPRPGEVVSIPYPFVPSSEVVVSLLTAQADRTLVGLSAVRFSLVGAKDEALKSSTEFDGRAVLENLRPGHYKLVLDADQASRLQMALKEPVEFDVTTEGRTINLRGVIVFTREPSK